MGFYASIWNRMGSYGYLDVLMGPNASSWIPVGPYVSL